MACKACEDVRNYRALKALSNWRSDVLVRNPNSIIVATNGCFDILHVGHLKLLSEAKKLGDYLVVGINSDQGVRELKGDNRPINPQEERKKILEALRFVDYVHIFSGKSASTFLEIARPNIYVKASDYALETLDPVEKLVLNNLNADIRFVDFIPGKSTSKIVEAMHS